jgi:DNA polymerase III alpha subunit (gram-positive type)
MIGLDCEYIAETALGDELPNSRPDVEKVYCELLQISACKLDNHGKEADTFNVFLKPYRVNNLPAWITNMTGITNNTRSHGDEFKEALTKLVDFVGKDECWIFNGDWNVINGNCQAHNIPMPFSMFHRLKPKLSTLVSLDQFKDAGYNEVCSGGLYKVFGLNLPVEGNAHDALHDARSLVHTVHHLTSKGLICTI